MKTRAVLLTCMAIVAVQWLAAADATELVNGLSSGDAAARQSAWRKAPSYGAEAIAPVGALLDDKDPAVARAATLAIEAIVGQATAAEDTRSAASEALVDAAQTVKSRLGRDAILKLLAFAGGPEAVNPLVEMLASPDTFGMALFALQGIGGEEATKGLIGALVDTEDGGNRAGIVTALGAIGHPSAVDLLLAEAKGKGPSAEAAIVAVGRTGDARAAEVLWERLQARPTPQLLEGT